MIQLNFYVSKNVTLNIKIAIRIELKLCIKKIKFEIDVCNQKYCTICHSDPNAVPPRTYLSINLTLKIKIAIRNDLN